MDVVDHKCLGALGMPDGAMVLRRVLTWDKAQHLVEVGLPFMPACRFNDRLEGRYPRRNPQPKLIVEHNRTVVLVSCWTCADPLTRRHWTEYASMEEGIAVESTAARLYHCLGQEFMLVPVRYIDFDRDVIPIDHSLRPFTCKDRYAFEWEQEVRIIGEMARGSRIVADGTVRDCSVNLDALVTRVLVSPNASIRFLADVKELFQKGGFRGPVEVCKR